jgi:MFS family permease
LRALPRQFWLLTSGVFVFVVGVSMCYPFQTIYLNRWLGIPMTTVGLVLGLALLAGLPMQVVGGAMADRFGRRPVLMVGIVATMALYIGLGLTGSFWVIVALFTFEAAFGWAQTLIASNAMVADLTSLERRAEAFSIIRVALNAGMVVGPLLAAPLITRDPSFRLAFVGGAAFCGVFLLMVAFMFKETRPDDAVRAASGESVVSTLKGYAQVMRDRLFLRFSLIALLPLYGFGQVWVSTPIVLGELHGVSAQSWGRLMALYAAVTAITQYPVVRLARRWDPMLCMAAASALLGIGMGGVAYAPWPATVGFIIVVSLGIVLLIPIASAIVSELAPVHLRGRYMGAWTIVYIGGYALGPLVGGWALDTLGSRGAFALIAAAGLLGAALFPLLRRPAPQP